MGASVVDGSVNTDNWKKDKPKDYKGTVLDKAIAEFEKLSGKKVPIPASLPTMPKQTAKAYEGCIKDLEDAVKVMKTAASHMKDLAKALDSVSSAAKSTASELSKLSDDTKDKDKRNEYSTGASTVSAIGGKADSTASKLK